MPKLIKFEKVYSDLHIHRTTLVDIQNKLGMPYYSDCTPEQVKHIKTELKTYKKVKSKPVKKIVVKPKVIPKPIKKITSLAISKKYKVSMPTISLIKKKLGIPKGKGLSKENADRIIFYLNNKPKSMNDMEKKYKISSKTISKMKKGLGYEKHIYLDYEQSKKLEKVVINYLKIRDKRRKKHIKNNYTTAKQCEIVKNKLDMDGFIKSTEITKLFNGRHISTSVKVIEKELGIQLYDDTIKELGFGKIKDSQSDDNYKTIRVYRSLTKYMEDCREDRKQMNGQRNGQVTTNERGMFRRVV